MAAATAYPSRPPGAVPGRGDFGGRQALRHPYDEQSGATRRTTPARPLEEHQTGGRVEPT